MAAKNQSTTPTLTPLNLPMTVERTDICDVYRCGDVSMAIVHDAPAEPPSFAFTTDSASWTDVRALFALLLLPVAQEQIRNAGSVEGDGSIWCYDAIAEYAAMEAIQGAGEQPSAEEVFNLLHLHGFAFYLWEWSRMYDRWLARGRPADSPWRAAPRFYELEQDWQRQLRECQGQPRTKAQNIAEAVEREHTRRNSILGRIRPRRIRRKKAA